MHTLEDCCITGTQTHATSKGCKSNLHAIGEAWPFSGCSELHYRPGGQLTLRRWAQGQKWPVTVSAASPTTAPLHQSCKCQLSPWWSFQYYFKWKLVGRCKGIWKLALEESQMGTTGSIWRANDEAFYELISQRGRGGSFPGLEKIKIAAD